MTSRGAEGRMLAQGHLATRKSTWDGNSRFLFLGPTFLSDTEPPPSSVGWSARCQDTISVGLPRLLHLQVVILKPAGSTSLELGLGRPGLQLHQPGQPQRPLATHGASQPPLESGDNHICTFLPGPTGRLTGNKVCGSAQHAAD